MYGYNQNLICTPTQYAKNNGAYEYTITENDYNSIYKHYGYTRDVIGRRGSYWYTRTPGYTNSWVYVVHTDGTYSDYGVYQTIFAVRPALYISIVNPTSIKLNKTSSTMYYGESLTLTATLSPSDVTEKTITWSSSNSAVATVNNGVIKAKSAGKTTITAKTVNGLTATCEVTVFADNTPR